MSEPKVRLTAEHREILKKWFKLQDELLEPLPKKLQGTYHPAIDVGLAMEHAMDIARELSKWPYTHLPYIEEKLRFLESRMEDLDYYLRRMWREVPASAGSSNPGLCWVVPAGIILGFVSLPVIWWITWSTIPSEG